MTHHPDIDALTVRPHWGAMVATTLLAAVMLVAVLYASVCVALDGGCRIDLGRETGSLVAAAKRPSETAAGVSAAIRAGAEGLPALDGDAAVSRRKGESQ